MKYQLKRNDKGQWTFQCIARLANGGRVATLPEVVQPLNKSFGKVVAGHRHNVINMLRNGSHNPVPLASTSGKGK